MVDHFSGLTYAHLMINTSQDATLEGKSSFEIWSSKFGVKIKIYHADNGRFAAQHFISADEDYNKTITFCGVGYHHQKENFEIKIQTLTLRPRTLLLHKKRY